jgi:hypothetical protein
MIVTGRRGGGNRKSRRRRDAYDGSRYARLMSFRHTCLLWKRKGSQQRRAEGRRGEGEREGGGGGGEECYLT